MPAPITLTAHTPHGTVTRKSTMDVRYVVTSANLDLKNVSGYYGAVKNGVRVHGWRSSERAARMLAMTRANNGHTDVAVTLAEIGGAK